MKLESTLHSRRSLLHFASLLDIVFLLLFFFLLSSDAVVRSGIAVTTPRSWSALHSAAGADVITISTGNPPQIFFNDRLVDIEELEHELREETGKEGPKQVVLRADQSAHFGQVIKICNIVASAGYSPILATRTN